MPLFECEQCGYVDNTALTHFWEAFMDESPPRLCSVCDPSIGRWHGRFDRILATELQPKEIDYPARKIGKVKP